MSHELKLGLVIVFRSFSKKFSGKRYAPTQENSLERIARTKSSKFISKSMGKENDVHCWTFSIKNLLIAIYTEIIYKRIQRDKNIYPFVSINFPFPSKKRNKEKVCTAAE